VGLLGLREEPARHERRHDRHGRDAQEDEPRQHPEAAGRVGGTEPGERVDERERPDPRGGAQGELEPHRASEREADDVGGWRVELVEQRVDPLGHRLDGQPFARERRPPVAREIDEQEAVALAKGAKLRRPVRGRGAESVKEEDGRSRAIGPATPLVVHALRGLCRPRGDRPRGPRAARGRRAA